MPGPRRRGALWGAAGRGGGRQAAAAVAAAAASLGSPGAAGNLTSPGAAGNLSSPGNVWGPYDSEDEALEPLDDPLIKPVRRPDLQV